jgi:phosphoserine aminotransferase
MIPMLFPSIFGFLSISPYSFNASANFMRTSLPESILFKAPAAKEDRSLTNVVFVTGNPDLDKKFVNEAKKEGLVTLNGHRSVGGLRANLYNAMPLDGVKALVEFIKKFDKENS